MTIGTKETGLRFNGSNTEFPIAFMASRVSCIDQFGRNPSDIDFQDFQVALTGLSEQFPSFLKPMPLTPFCSDLPRSSLPELGGSFTVTISTVTSTESATAA